MGDAHYPATKEGNVDGSPSDVWLSTRLTRRQILRLAALGVVGVPALNALASCGSSGTSAVPKSQAAADRTAILKFGQMRGQSYDPIRMVAVEDVQLNVLFDTLVSLSPVTAQLEPRLASSWTINSDRVRFHLRPGVVFQDNTPVNADAVKFSIDRVLTDPASNIKTQLYMVDHVEVVDPATVDVVLKVPAPNPLLTQMTTRPGMIVSPTAVKAAGSSNAFSQQPVGAGMYRIQGAWHPRESMSVRAWPGYWDKSAQLLGGIDFTEIAGNAVVNAIRSGSDDVGAAFNGVDVAVLRADPGLRVKVGEGMLVHGLNININIPPLDNPKIRQAIAYAIDRDSVVKALSAGLAQPAYQLFFPGSPAYDKSLDGLYKYDPGKAKQLMTEAGFPNGFTFASVIGGTAAAYVQFGELVQGQLKAHGINMDLKLVDQAQTIPMLYRLGGHGTAASAPIGVVATAATTDQFCRQSLLREGYTNPGGVEVPGVRDLLDKAASAPDPKTAAGYYQQVNRIVAQGLYACIPVYYDPGICAYHNYVGGITRGFTDTDTNPNLLRGVYITQGKVPAS